MSDHLEAPPAPGFGQQTIAVDVDQGPGIATLLYLDGSGVDYEAFRWPEPETWPAGAVLVLHPEDFATVLIREHARRRGMN